MGFIVWIIILAIATILCVYGTIAFRKEVSSINKAELTFDSEIERYNSLIIGRASCFISSIILLVVMAIVTLANTIYSQDPGNASVLVNISGSVSEISYESGFHAKAPWTSRIIYDIRNNTLDYSSSNNGKDQYTGEGNVSGPQITFQDAQSVTGNIDLTVRYSIRGNEVEAIYNEFKTQEDFVNSVLAPAVRSLTREVFSKYNTADVYNSRNTITQDLTEQLAQNWDKYGVDVEEVYLQEVRYPDEVVQSFTKAQSAQTKVETAKADQERARIEAETNNIKSEGLTQEVLMEQLIDAIKNGNGTYVIDPDSLVLDMRK